MKRRTAMCLAVVMIALYLLTGCLGLSRTQAEKGAVSGVIAGQPVVVQWTRDTEGTTNVEIPPALVSALSTGVSATPWGALITGAASVVGAWSLARSQAQKTRADEHKADADEAWNKLAAAEPKP